MSRNSSGTYTLPTGNPVVSGTVITSTWANDTMGDIATALTDSLSRSGKGGMSAAFRSVDGTVSVPGISFNNETTTGFYRAAAGDVRLSVLGSDILSVNSSAAVTLQSSTAYYPQVALKNSAVDANSGYYIFDKSRGGAIVNSGDVLGNVVWRGFDGTNFVQAAAIIGYCSGAPGTNDMPGALGFFTTADGASSPTRRAYIDAVGDLTLDHINANTSAQAANVYADANGKLYVGTQTSLPATATTAEMQAGTQTALRSMSPSLVASAISALAQGKFIKSVSAVGPGAYTINVYGGWNSIGFSATITPSSTSSKIVVLAASTGSNLTNVSAGFAIFRNGTNVSGDLPVYNTVAIQPQAHFIDSPATTSACTYAFYYRYSGGGYITGATLYNPSIVLLEVQA